MPDTADFSTGTSNFGNFTSIQSHCITPPVPAPFDNGLFTWTFASGDTLTGTYFGALTASGTPGVFNDTENYTITGGTGLFAGATGNILGIGTVTFSPNSFPLSNVSLNGTVTTVPEPTTMILLGTGLAAMVAKVRKRRKTHGDDEAA
ncbi:MAG: PEP-CTERM sorting domain-containing protein [Acidobacteriota bacterium]|nr:PEP-CTERM sorting domain-containing protein [Acidobacteriota bacterium]